MRQSELPMPSPWINPALGFWELRAFGFRLLCGEETGIFASELLQRKAVTKWCVLGMEGLAGPGLGGTFDLTGRRGGGGGDATCMLQHGERVWGTCPCKLLTENLHYRLVLNLHCPGKPQVPAKVGRQAKGRASTGGGSLDVTPDLAFPCGSKCAF